MTRVPLAPGTPLVDARRRMVGRGFWLPSPAPEGVNLSSTRAPATATADVAAHTKGAWTQVIAATTTEVTMVTVCLTAATFVSAADSSTLLDVGVGAAGSEVALISNLAVGYRTAFDRYDVPVVVPQGSRLSVRCQSVIGAKTVAVVLVLGKLPFGRRPANHVVTIGADTSTSHGVALAVPGANNVDGAWTEITAATTEPFGGLVIGEQGNADSTFNTGSVLIDVAVGASGSEVVVIADLSYTAANTESLSPHGPRTYPVDVPLGTRIAARYQTNATANSVDLTLYGLPRQ